jgi:hypothetical protein
MTTQGTLNLRPVVYILVIRSQISAQRATMFKRDQPQGPILSKRTGTSHYAKKGRARRALTLKILLAIFLHSGLFGYLGFRPNGFRPSGLSANRIFKKIL